MHFEKMKVTLQQQFSATIEDWDGYVSFFEEQALAPGEHWVKAGELCSDFFYIADGLVRLYYIDAQGNEVNEGFYEEGSLLGPISSFYEETPCPYYIQAIEPCTLLVANYQKAHAYAADKTDVLEFEIRFMHRLFVSNAKRDAKRLISNGEQRYKWFCKEYAHLLDRIPQYYIASFLGMTPVSLSRLRKSLKPSL
jgi:CRP-like cAMP-binding protein